MSTRPIIAYDDIALPYDLPEGHDRLSSHSHAPPAKKRKRNNNQREDRTGSRSNVASTSTTSQQYAADTSTTAEDADGEHDEAESRELTHEEIWNDSALVDAWEAAKEEYHAYHRKPGDSTKTKGPVKKKSALWYNIPVDPSKPSTNVHSSNPRAPSVNTDDAGPTNEDSKPLDFDTFVPSHDPTLVPSSLPADAAYTPDTPAGAMISQDDAFQRAMNAMYWGGYWTAMYHYQRQLSQQHNLPTADASSSDEDSEAEEGEENEG